MNHLKRRNKTIRLLLLDGSASARRCAEAIERLGESTWTVRVADAIPETSATHLLLPAWLFLSTVPGTGPAVTVAYGAADQLVAARARGARDFLVDPWTLDEANARFLALDRRPGDLVLSGAVLTGARQSVTLTAGERYCMELLLQHRGHVVPRDVLGPGGRSTDVLVSRLRSRIAAAVGPDGIVPAIRGVRGRGYRLERDEPVETLWKTSGQRIQER